MGDSGEMMPKLFTAKDAERAKKSRHSDCASPCDLRLFRRFLCATLAIFTVKGFLVVFPECAFGNRPALHDHNQHRL